MFWRSIYIYTLPQSWGLNSGNFITVFLWNLLQFYNPEDQSRNLTTTLQSFKVCYGYRLKVSVINHTRSSGVLLLRYVLLLGTFTAPRNFPLLEKLSIHESQASAYVYIKKSQICLFLPISCTCIFIVSMWHAFSSKILHEMQSKLGFTIPSIDGYSSEVSCEIGLWWSPRQKN